jgi:hypothetical protein
VAAAAWATQLHFQQFDFGHNSGMHVVWTAIGKIGRRLGGRFDLAGCSRLIYFVALGWLGRRVLRFDRGPEPGPPVVLEVDFVPDNLRWSERGTLLAAGSNPAGAGGWTIFEIDPDAMTGVALATIGPGAALQGASTAVQVGGQLWVGTPGGDRVGYLDLR